MHLVQIIEETLMLNHMSGKAHNGQTPPSKKNAFFFLVRKILFFKMFKKLSLYMVVHIESTHLWVKRRNWPPHDPDRPKIIIDFPEISFFEQKLLFG